MAEGQPRAAGPGAWPGWGDPGERARPGGEPLALGSYGAAAETPACRPK